MPVEAFGPRELDQLPCFFHRTVPGPLSLRLRPCLGWTIPARQRVGRLHISGDLSCDAQANTATAHFWKANCVFTTVGFVFEVTLALPELAYGPGKITVPLHRVHCEIEMSVEDEHRDGQGSYIGSGPSKGTGLKLSKKPGLQGRSRFR